MKKFLAKIFWFILPILIIIYPLDLFISYNLKKSNDSVGEFEVWNDIYEGKASCDIAIYGSSRAVHHINPKILEDSLQQRVYNFGIIGQHFEIQYLRHLEFLKYNDKPKLIILSLDTFTLVKNKSLYNQGQFLPNMLFNRNIKEFTVGYNDLKTLDYYLPLVRYFGKSESLFKTARNFFLGASGVNKLRYKGYYERGTGWDDEFDRKYITKAKYELFLDQKNIDLLEQFIKECRSLNIKLVLVYTPEYIEHQQYVSNRENILGIYKQFAAKYNLIFLDFSDDEICTQKDLFFDSLHLTGKGSNIFTEKLALKLGETLPNDNNHRNFSAKPAAQEKTFKSSFK